MEGYQELKELWILKDCKQDTCRDFIQYGKIVTYPRNRFCIRAVKRIPIYFLFWKERFRSII